MSKEKNLEVKVNSKKSLVERNTTEKDLYNTSFGKVMVRNTKKGIKVKVHRLGASKFSGMNRSDLNEDNIEDFVDNNELNFLDDMYL